MQDQLRAIIYIVLGRPQTAAWRRRCHEWVDRRGYRLVSLIEEKPEDMVARPGLASGLRMLMGGEAEVMVVATADYLPGDWVPRLEVAGDSDEPFAIPPENRPRNAGPPAQRRARRRAQRPQK